VFDSSAQSCVLRSAAGTYLGTNTNNAFFSGHPYSTATESCYYIALAAESDKAHALEEESDGIACRGICAHSLYFACVTAADDELEKADDEGETSALDPAHFKAANKC